MKVLFKSREPEAIAMHELAKTRSEFVFRRLAWLISKATVSLSDINGPRGGVDKRCQVEVQIDRSNTVVATSIARDWRGAIDLALARAARTLVRKRQSAKLARRVRARSVAYKLAPDETADQALTPAGA
ncbi:HPF/RaiA family ribosome-associated protein [Caballeronia sp. LP006]|uniref:HPF/RaiA family ribosome-associated protein n=1 Tax=unclassified Caballeronia TaxID=2646786 RepID=UPI001FD18677|nr:MULTISPECIES: HPF/RaiA family ribosome-associated protein [unclassified Caballeronia]MDR5775921.1 HPF/RaiA family ribosome-associated protein [Caballeronia sp. LZ002]MDR5828634.1 HPF/RaiA family ribosome-associated protein [Caballeronia sp. LP006]MDR5851360.1 HPF/RaiA family ribosome-associated protein [Caballeronia sp. LZ003]